MAAISRVVSRTVARAGAISKASVQSAKSLSTLSSFPFDKADNDYAVFPANKRGLDYDLNWSLAADSLTTRGEAYRNASVRDLLEFAGPKKDLKVTPERALEIVSGPYTAPSKKRITFATDGLPNRDVMSVEEFEARLEALRSETLSYAPRLFVEDAAVGSSRTSELRVRFITDSPVLALAARSFLRKIPLYSAEAFPRTLVVYAGTLAAPDSTAMKGIEGPYTVVDVDPTVSRGVVMSVGNVSIEDIKEAIATAAGELQVIGGYRHVPGGFHVAGIAEARRDGVESWYFTDRHYYASPEEPHPTLVTLKNTIAVTDNDKNVLVVGASNKLSAKAVRADRLYAAEAVTWTPTGVDAFFGGASFPSSIVKGEEALPMVRGALLVQGNVELPLSGAKSVSHPSQVFVVGGKTGKLEGEEAVAAIVAAAGLSTNQAAKLSELITKSGAVITGVASEADVAKALKF